MAVAHDAVGTGPAPTADPSWTHTPSGTPRGVVVLVVQDGAGVETVTCTYGASSMTARTPIDGGTASEPGVIYPFVLLSSVPTGAQTVTVSASGSAPKSGASYTVTAAADTEVADEDSVVNSSLDDPSLTLSAASNGMTYGAIMSGLGTTGNVTAGANHTKDLSVSSVGQTLHTEHRTSAGTIGAVAFTTSAADDVVMYAVALVEAAGNTEHFASASLEITDTITVAAKKDAKASFAQAFTAGIVSAAVKTAQASASAPFTFGAVTAAKKVVYVSSATPIVLGVDTVAVKTAYASTVVPIVLTIDTAADTAITISASLEVTFGASVAASRTANASASLPVAVGVATAAVKTAYAVSATPLLLSVAATAAATRYVSADLPIVLTVATRMSTPSPVPNLDAVLTGWIGKPTVGFHGGGTAGWIEQPVTGGVE